MKPLILWVNDLLTAVFFLVVGFTMSLFIAGLAYGEGTAQHLQAKLGILAASVVCALGGLVVLAGAGRAQAEEAAS